MDRAELERRRRRIIDRHGPWSLHNIRLADGVYTMGPPRDQSSPPFPHVMQALRVAQDTTCKPLGELRVLDLGSHEGQYAIEFARHGAEVVAIEARAGNIEKAQLAKDWFGLADLELVQADVRSLSLARHGEFDVVLCLGLLYHLPARDAVELLRRIFAACGRVLVLDTHLALSKLARHRQDGVEYGGRRYREHDPEAAEEERLRASGASIDNPISFWFTRPSLCNLLADVGFTSVFECSNPVASVTSRDRSTFVALKGAPQELLTVPDDPAAAERRRWPERWIPRSNPAQWWPRQLLLRLPRVEARLGRAWRALRRRGGSA